MSKQKSIAEQESVLTEFLEKKSAVNSMVEDYNELEVLVRKQIFVESIQEKLNKTRKILSKLKTYLEERIKLTNLLTVFAIRGKG